MACNHRDITVEFDTSIGNRFIFERVRCNDCGLTWTEMTDLDWV